MLRILPRYVLRELAEAFVVALAAFTILFALAGMVEAVVRGLPAYNTLVLMAYEVPYKLCWMIPLATLTACVTAYGRLASDNEITAMGASGVHPFRFVAPAFTMAAVMTVACNHLNANVVPNSRFAQKLTRCEAVLEAPQALNGLGRTTIEFGAIQIVFSEMRDDLLYDVVTYSPNEEGAVQVARAAQARLRVDRKGKAIELILGRGKLYWLDRKDPFGQAEVSFNEYAERIELADAGMRVWRGWKDTSTADLKRIVRRGSYRDPRPGKENYQLPLDEEDRLEILTILNGRRAMAWSPIPFFLVGVPLGLITRRGKKIVGFAVSLLVVLVYYPLLLVGQGLAGRGLAPAWAALSAPDVILAGCGLVLMAALVWRR